MLEGLKPCPDCEKLTRYFCNTCKGSGVVEKEREERSIDLEQAKLFQQANGADR